MIEFIREVVARFGGRYFGSQQEKDAQYFTADVLKPYCDKVRIEPFESALEAHFQALKLFCVVHIVVLILLKINIPLAAGIGLLNSFFFLHHFVTYRHGLDFLFQKKTSWNVVGDIEPTEAATSTLIVAGHIDSVKEFKWWFKLKQPGAALTVISSFLLGLLGFYALGTLYVHTTWYGYIWWLFVLSTPMLIVMYDMHGERVVDGASDNLTGVAMAVEMAKVFSANRLKHTRLRVISFGSEEAGLRGAFAYARQYKQQLKQEKALLLNIDTIKDLEHLTIGTSELNTLVFFDKQRIDLLDASFKATGVHCKKLPLGVGASDASAFAIEGLPSLSIIGMDSQHLDPAYHTRLDTVDCIQPEAMEALKKVLIHFIETWDQNAAKP